MLEIDSQKQRNLMEMKNLEESKRAQLANETAVTEANTRLMEFSKN